MATRTRPVLRWAVPAGLAAVAVGGSLLAPAIAAAEPDLPDVTAAELLAGLRTEPVEGFSGTVVHRADLGLPTIPGLTGSRGGPAGESADALSLLDGEHTLRVWASAPDLFRVSLHGGLSELTVVTDGAEAWVWRSEGATATQVLLPEHDRAARIPPDLPPMTPEQYADLLLDRLDPSTEVTVGDPVRVAGRPAYELVLDPRTEDTLVDEVHIAIDAADRIPTRVRVWAVGHPSPAVEVGFTALRLVPPAEDLFAFTPPPGATTEVVDLRAHPDLRSGHRMWGEPGARGIPQSGRPGGKEPATVVGEGWASVLVAPLPPQVAAGLSGPRDEAADPDVRPGPPHRADENLSPEGVLGALPRVEGTWGSGRLLESRLFSALFTDDGRLLVGAVDGSALAAAAGAHG